MDPAPRDISVTCLTGEAILDALPALAALRIQVFRAYPYLYDGDLAYEQSYLQTFAAALGAIVVIARDGEKIVGASTGAPMAGVEDDWSAPFIQQGHDIDDIFYCGESVLDPAYRGRGIGHAFFDHREAQAQSLGKGLSCFCAVVRPDDHPMRPEGYRPLDGFWQKRGYEPLAGMQAEFRWKDIGNEQATSKRLQFWTRTLADQGAKISEETQVKH